MIVLKIINYITICIWIHINFTYPISNVPDWGYLNYKENQRKIIADTFGLELQNVELVQED